LPLSSHVHDAGKDDIAVVLDEERVPPVFDLSPEERDERAAVERLGSDSAEIEKRRSEIQGENHRVDERSGLGEGRVPNHEGNAERLFVSESAFFGKSVLAVEEPVVARHYHHGILELALLLQNVQHAPEALVDGHEHPEAIANRAIGENGFGAEGRESVDGALERGFSHGGNAVARTPRNLGVGIEVPVALGGDEPSFPNRGRGSVVVLDDVRMKRLVGEEEDEGLVSLARQELHGAIGEEVGDVALDFPGGPVLMQIRVDRLPLSLHAHPVVESGPPGLVVSHVPLSEKRGVVPRGVEQPGKRQKLVAVLAAVGVVGDPVSSGVETGEDVGPAGRAKWRGRERVLEPRSLTGDAVDVRRLDERVAIGAHVIPSQVVDDDHQKLAHLPLRH
jgi:hypothetical protein